MYVKNRTACDVISYDKVLWTFRSRHSFHILFYHKVLLFTLLILNVVHKLKYLWFAEWYSIIITWTACYFNWRGWHKHYQGRPVISAIFLLEHCRISAPTMCYFVRKWAKCSALDESFLFTVIVTTRSVHLWTDPIFYCSLFWQVRLWYLQISKR